MHLKGQLTMTKKYEEAFISHGFSNWKKACERLHRHQVRECHREALVKMKQLDAPSVSECLSSQARKEQAENREMLLKQLSTLRFLLRQGLAIRGHSEGDGNLVQLLHLRGEDDPRFEKWFKRHQYMSHDIVNEMINLMGHAVLRALLKDIREACWFSIIADETRDISNKEQLAIGIRWVDEKCKVQEDLIGLVHVPSTTSATLTAAIKDILVRCVLPLSNCRGQAYDGAANMMGHLHGVGTQIQAEQPVAIKVHCLAHRLNLVLQDAARKCFPIRNTLDVIIELAQLILCSPKRSFIFQQCKQEFSQEGSATLPY